MARTSVDITRELWLRLISGEPLTRRTVWNYLESPCVHHFVSGRTCRYLQNPNIGEFISANRLDWTGKVLCLFCSEKHSKCAFPLFRWEKRFLGEMFPLFPVCGWAPGCFYRTHVHMGSDHWVAMSVRHSVRELFETLCRLSMLSMLWRSS